MAHYGHWSQVSFWPSKAPRESLSKRLRELGVLHAIVRADGTHIHVARYVGPWSWASRDSAERGGSGGRSSFRLETRQATIR